MIVATVRTRDEQANIRRWITAYQGIADLILVADGGSSDETVKIASKMPKTKVRLFTERIRNEQGVWRNPHGKHINFLIDWAVEEGADIIIFDDCDCFPSKGIKKIARSMFAGLQNNINLNSLFAYRVYVRGTDQYYPNLSWVGQSIWAWQPEAGIRASEDDPWKHHIDNLDRSRGLYLGKKYCLLHYSWPTDAEIERKLAFYRSYKEEGALHPDQFGGPLEPLPEYARE